MLYTGSMFGIMTVYFFADRHIGKVDVMMFTRREKERQTREHDMIKAAEQVFCQYGFEAAGMDEIAKEAQFTKRTLYQYFENKYELYFAVALRGYQLLDSLQTAVEKKEQNGYDKLESMYHSYYKFYRENLQLYRLMNGWSHIKNKSEGAGPWESALILYHNNMIHRIAAVIEEGKADGSIQPETDAQKTSRSIVFLMNGFFDQLTASGDALQADYALDQESFCRFTIDLVIKPLKKNRTILATRKGTV